MKLGDKLDNWRYDRKDFNSTMQRIEPSFLIVCWFLESVCLYLAIRDSMWIFLAIYFQAALMFYYEPVMARLQAIQAFNSIPEMKALTVKEELEW